MLLKNKIRKAKGLPKKGEVMVIAYDDKNASKEMRAIKLEAIGDTHIKITNLQWGVEPIYLEPIAKLLIEIAKQDERLQTPSEYSVYYNKEDDLKSIEVYLKDEIEGWGIIERELTRYKRSFLITDSHTCPIWILPYLIVNNLNTYKLLGEIIPLSKEELQEKVETQDYMQTEAPHD